MVQKLLNKGGPGIDIYRPEGPVVHLDRKGFIDALSKTYRPTVYECRKGIFRVRYRYIFSWSGESFYTCCRKKMQFTDFVNVVRVKDIKGV